MSLRSRFPKLSHEDHGNIALEHLKKKYKNENIDDVISSLRDLIDSGIYERLFNVYLNWKEPVPLDSARSTEIALESQLLILAYENLTHPPNPFSSRPIDHNAFYSFYPFLELIYSMYLEKQLTSEDVKNLFKSNIGEKITFFLEEFDKEIDPPHQQNSFENFIN